MNLAKPEYVQYGIQKSKSMQLQASICSYKNISSYVAESISWVPDKKNCKCSPTLPLCIFVCKPCSHCGPLCPRCKHGLIILQGQDYFHKGPHYDPDENGNPSVFSWSKSFNITAAPKVIVFGAFIKITALEVRFF